jgi:hypothetical protein
VGSLGAFIASTLSSSSYSQLGLLERPSGGRYKKQSNGQNLTLKMIIMNTRNIIRLLPSFTAKIEDMKKKRKKKIWCEHHTTFYFPLHLRNTY